MASKCKVRYRLIDHTADCGLQVTGSDIKNLFENAAYAMFDLIADIGTGTPRGHHRPLESKTITVDGSDWPDLMVNWLRELLYFWAGEDRLMITVDITSILEFRLSAGVTFDSFDPHRHEIKKEIKAVTYHRIDVRQTIDSHHEDTPDGTAWESTIIFDV